MKKKSYFLNYAISHVTEWVYLENIVTFPKVSIRELYFQHVTPPRGIDFVNYSNVTLSFS